jgi:drug/metabolite transporter (DMT)-like permease
LVLNVGALAHGQAWSPGYTQGVAAALVAAVVFSFAMWITEHKLATLDGALRTASLQSIVCVLTWAVIATHSSSPLVAWPRDVAGAWALAGLAVLYASAFGSLFVIMPRLNMRRNAPVLNAEPVATLAMGWVVLGQALSMTQLLGAALVVIAVVNMGRRD